MAVMNFTQQDTFTFKPMPRGKYNGTLLNVVDKPSASGNPMWTWFFQVNDDESQFDGRKITVWTVLAEDLTELKTAFDEGDIDEAEYNKRVTQSKRNQGNINKLITGCVPYIQVDLTQDGQEVNASDLVDIPVIMEVGPSTNRDGSPSNKVTATFVFSPDDEDDSDDDE